MPPMRWAAVLVFAAGVGVAAYWIGKYEAWWTISFAVGALALAIAAGRRGAAGSIAIGVVVSLCIALAVLGSFLVWMGLHPGGAACLPEQCSDPGPRLLLAGAGALALAVLGFGLSVRHARR